MLVPSLWVILGLLLLVSGGELLLRGAVGAATLLRLTPAVIGLTVVAAGTSVPELAVSLIAAVQGKPDITVSNVVGSNIFNILLILGLAAVLRPLILTGNTVKLEYPVLALVTLMYLAVANDGFINRLDATLFLAVYVCFTAYMVGLVREQMNLAERLEMQQEVRELTVDHARPRPLICLVLVAGGIMLLGLGAQWVVSGAVDLARLWGVSERVIGLTVVAMGTGLPEVVTSLVSIFRGRGDVAIGNVIGSNLINILGTMGLSGMFSALPISPETIHFDNWWLLGVTLLLLPLMATRDRIGRGEGLLLLAVYAAYLTVLLLRL